MHHLRLLIIRTVSRSAQFVSSQHLVSLWALLLYVVYCFFASLCIHPGVFMWLIYSLIESRLLQARAEAFVMLIAGRWTAAVPFYQNTQPFFFCGGSDSWGSGSFVTWEKVALHPNNNYKRQEAWKRLFTPLKAQRVIIGLIKPQNIFRFLSSCQIRSLCLFIWAGTNKNVLRFIANCHVSSPPVRGVKASPAGKLYIKRPL